MYFVDLDLHSDLIGFEAEALGDQIRDPEPNHPERHDRILVRLSPLRPLVDRDAFCTERGGVVDRGDCGTTTLLQPVGDDDDCLVGNHINEVVLQTDGSREVVGLLRLLGRAGLTNNVDQGIHFCLSNTANILGTVVPNIYNYSINIIKMQYIHAPSLPVLPHPFCFAKAQIRFAVCVLPRKKSKQMLRLFSW